MSVLGMSAWVSGSILGLGLLALAGVAQANPPDFSVCDDQVGECYGLCQAYVAVDCADQFHRPKSPQDEAQGVALVIVAVPHGDTPLAAKRQQLLGHPPVPRAPVFDANQGGIQFFGSAPKLVEPRVPGRVHVGA